MLFTHKLHMGEGAGQTSGPGHRAPNTDVRADSQAEDRMRRRPGRGYVGGTSKPRRGARNDL